MATLNWEVNLNVEDFVERDEETDEVLDTSCAFDDAREADDVALALAEAEIEDLVLPSPVRVASILFCEFDSSNWTHAGAHFDVVYEGSHEALEVVAAHFREEYELTTDEMTVND